MGSAVQEEKIMNETAKTMTLEAYAIQRLEEYRNEIRMLEETIEEQKELLDNQGEILSLIDARLSLSESGNYLNFDWLAIDSRDGKKIVEFFGLTVPKKEEEEDD